VKGFRNHFDPSFKEAAEVLWSLFKHYGNVAQKSYDAETAAINDFIREFQRPEIEAAAELLRVNNWLAELAHANITFNLMMMDRDSEAIAKTNFRMRTARLETDKYYRAIVANIENEALIGDVSPKLQNFITELNAAIKRYKNRMAQKQGRKKVDSV